MQGTSTHTTTTRDRDKQRRRGSVIILAVAVLAVLAISAASYVTITRLDRSSAASYSRQTGFLQQRDAVVGHLRSLIAADLFGNKVVEGSTPRQRAGREIWPRRFEDGEHWDAPAVVPFSNVNRFTFDTRTTEQQERGDQVPVNARLDWAPGLAVDGMYAPAWPDDAWLGSAEPYDLQPGLAGDAWDTWPQITNLRSEYRWNDQDQWWERSDGRYVDLANFFLSGEANRLSRGDPGADLTDLDEDALSFTPNELTNVRVMIDQPVYHLQMNHMEEARRTGDYTSFNADSFTLEDAPFEQVDMRMWADADGDGRPDSRWQELDALGSSKGLRWVVAARTIDASSMVNANASLEWGDTGDPDSVGAGVTPADIDLRRLVETASRDTGAAFGGETTLRHPDIANLTQSDFAAYFNEHLVSGLNLGALSSAPNAEKESAVLWEIDNRAISDNEDPFRAWTLAFDDRMVDSWATDGGVFEPGNLMSREYTTRAQREAYYTFVGSSLNRSGLQFRNAYDWKDNERELRAFWGFNDPSAVTPLEQRFDGPQNNPVSRLPGSTGNPPYPDAGSLGPMRSAEDLDAPRTFDNAANLPGLSGGTYTQQDKVRRIENDVRRLLTTYNGSGFVSPQPGWSVNDDGDKLFLGDVPEPTDERGMRRFLSKAMGSFMWALAPLAGDRPVMRAGDAGNPINLAEVVDSRAHYGGWQFGPAAAVEGGTGAGPSGPGTGPNPGTGPTPGTPTGQSGAYVALRTSAALAVNLADAIDDEGPDASPTIMRVLKNYNVEQTLNGGSVTGEPLPPLATSGDRLIEVGVDFTHGALPIGLSGEAYSSLDALPADTANVPELWFPSSNDMVVVGLDRQPFINEVASMAMFAVSFVVPDPAPTQPFTVPVTKNDGVGWLMAVELSNPWPTEIRLDDYTVIISDGTDSMEIELVGQSIPPGEVRVFYASGRSPLLADVWDDEVLDDWRSQVPDAVGLNTPVVVTGDLFDLSQSVTPSVLLVREVGGVEVLLDRYTPPAPDEPFPYGELDPIQSIDPTATDAALVEVLDADIVPDEEFIIGFLDGASMQRPTEPLPGSAGFPVSVIERPSSNLVIPQSGGLPDFALPAAQLTGRGMNALMLEREHNQTLGDPKTSFDDDPVPSFQLFVPDGPLLSPSELLQLCSYAHTYRGDGATFGVDENREAGVSGAPPSWTTISEQLGADQALAYDGSMAPGTGNHNPFFGALDFSRGVISPTDPDGIALTNWSSAGGVSPDDVPQELRIPLALRVLDAFETLGSVGNISQGRININTAPDRVLRVLPLVDPREGPGYTTYPNLGGWNTTTAAALGRVNSILDYREWRTNYRSPIDGSTLRDTPQQITQPGLEGLRAPEGPTGQPAQEFVSLGELAILHPWERNTGQPTAALEAGFAEVGFDGPNPNPSGGVESALDIRPSATNPNSGSYDGSDDLEERLALVRAITAVTSTRSDVFITWFVIRGYSPAAIEAIPVPAGATADEKAELLNQLEPAHESRWLVVLDRSNVREPTDRPEIILLTQLPPTSP